ncbi:TNF receptor-associated factor 3-like [Paramuricea clavata]|uniref:TNF receptor-associated factor 3-like n=1 Tax=Paramuricea clavata TaxID=317549 RepID=A0A6S7J5A8_PARCT|nr:TNF receptor-associated factor 3-like [Paramuricea clavata]
MEAMERYQNKMEQIIDHPLLTRRTVSNEFGYKMCAKLSMNGDGFGKESHLPLFFVVMKGDYDALQTWPLQKKITKMLLDQGNGAHMIDAFNSDPQSSSFQRPRSDMKYCFRFPALYAS